MDKRLPDILISVFRGCRLSLHFLCGMLLAIFYPYLNQTRQRRILKTWSRQLLNILNIGIRTEGPRLVRGESGCLVIANHVSWLDIFVLNAVYPSRFIAKAEVRNWPLIGWLIDDHIVRLDMLMKPALQTRDYTFWPVGKKDETNHIAGHTVNLYLQL